VDENAVGPLATKLDKVPFAREWSCSEPNAAGCQECRRYHSIDYQTWSVDSMSGSEKRSSQVAVLASPGRRSKRSEGSLSVCVIEEP